MVKWTVLIGFLAVASAAAVCMPEIFTTNRFINGLLNHEILNIMAVILTVTLASVANIHLSLNRIIEKSFVGRIEDGKKAAAQVRSEINTNAWLLCYIFAFSCIVLFLIGGDPENANLKAFLAAIMLTALLAYILILYDIYAVVYKLAAAEL